jgi:chromosome segregation ATPase
VALSAWVLRTSVFRASNDFSDEAFSKSKEHSMDLATFLNTYWPYIVAALGGLFVGWLVTWLVYRRRSQQYEAQLYNLQSKLKDGDRALAEAREEGEKLQANLTASQDKLSALEAEHKTLQEEKSSIAGNLVERTNRLNDLNQRYTNLQTTYDQAIQTAADDKSALQASIEAAQAENQDLADELDGARLDQQALTQQLAASRATLGEIQSDLEGAKLTLSKKEIALNEAYGRIGTLQRDLEERNTGLLATQAELSTVREELSLAEAERNELEDRLHRARGDVAGEMALVTSTMLKKKDDALRQANARISILSKELEALKSAQVGS